MYDDPPDDSGPVTEPSLEDRVKQLEADVAQLTRNESMTIKILNEMRHTLASLINLAAARKGK